MPEVSFVLIDSDKQEISDKTDKNGLCRIEDMPCGAFEVLFEEGSDTFSYDAVGRIIQEQQDNTNPNK